MRRAVLFKLRHYLISGFIGQRLEWNPMAFMQLKVYPTDDKSSVTIELWQEGKPLGHILLAGSEAEGFCQSVVKPERSLQMRSASRLIRVHGWRHFMTPCTRQPWGTHRASMACCCSCATPALDGYRSFFPIRTRRT